MAGAHNLSIYSSDDNPFCPKCLNGEKIVGEKVFSTGGTICLGDGVPSRDGCQGYQPKLEEE